MNKLFTKIAGVFLGLAMAVGVGIAANSSSEAVPVSAATAQDVYVFTANDYSGTLNEKEYVASETFSNVTLSGGSFLNEGIQHLAGKSSTVTTVKSYPNVSKIVMNYCTNKSKGSGKLTVKVGSGTEKSFSVKAPKSN